MRLKTVCICLGLILTASSFAFAQADTSVGSIVVRGRNVKGPDKTKIPLSRKRFYLFPGGLADNADLIEGIRAAETTSRDCFYSNLKASPCFIAWLQEGNCESPFCRAVKREDIAGIKEFELAYAKGLATYRNKPDLALSWMFNNLPSDLASGYYRQQRSFVEKVTQAKKPLQTILSTAAGAEANFAGVPVTGKSTKYFVSNIVPVEIGNKAYTWACEIDVQPAKPTTLILALPLDPKRKNCVLVEKELKVCSTDSCKK